MSSCYDCLYRDYVEPERCGDIPFWTCTCETSPIYGMISCCSVPCDSYKPVFKEED